MTQQELSEARMQVIVAIGHAVVTGRCQLVVLLCEEYHRLMSRSAL